MSFADFLPMLIAASGIFFLIKLRCFFIIHPLKTLKRIRSALSDKASRKSLALALAGTLGIGNIVGIAYGISIGGAGSVLWVLISGVFASVIKYAESSLAAEFRDTGRGGMAYVMLSSFKRCAGFLSRIYAVLCLCLSLTMGSALQGASAASAAEYSVGIKPYIFISVFAAAVIAVISFGSKRIETLTAKIIPMSTIIYITLCLSVIFINISELPRVCADILKSAFDFKSALGGGLAFLSAGALSEGFARGLLSNEAGAGSSAAAQSRSELKRSSDVGLLGMCEVFFDTTLLCTLSGFAVLMSGASLSGTGIEIVLRAFGENLGRLSSQIIFILIALFAYSTVICWYFYGSECVYFLFGKERSTAYTAAFAASLILGIKVNEARIITVCDIILFLMSVMTLFTLIKNSERIARLSENMID